jgi:hypothetical protein
MRVIKTVFALLLLALALPLCAQPLMNWQSWHTLLQQAVVLQRDGTASQVDYTYLATQKPALAQLLNEAAGVSRAQFDRASKPEQLAFLINLYNLATVDLVLTAYPKLASIKELGGLFSSPWTLERVQLFGSAVSLDTIEHTLIRGSGRYNDPRIHFAVNCASIGCPALREEAYVAERLEAQLQEQAQRFLSDRSRNRLSGNRLQVSSIFKWYGDDFGKGWGGARSLAHFLSLYSQALGLTEPQRQALLQQQIKIEFLPYDRALNRRPNS